LVGVALKDSWNRTQYDGDTLREMVTMVIRDNLFHENADEAILIYRNTKDVHVYNNIIRGSGFEDIDSNTPIDLENVPSGITIDSGQALFDPNLRLDTAWGEFQEEPAGWGPGTTENIFIYRNLIHSNLGRGVRIEVNGVIPYHGSIRNVGVVNNTVAYNGREGIRVVLSNAYEKTACDGSTYSLEGITSINNIYAFNYENSVFSDLPTFVQMAFRDFYSGDTRSFLYTSLNSNYNCIYSPSSTETILINDGGGEGLMGLGDWQNLSEAQSGVRQDAESRAVDPLFVDAPDGDYHLQPISQCIGNGTSITGVLHEDTDPPTDVGQSPDIEGNPIVNGTDIGAYQS